MDNDDNYTRSIEDLLNDGYKPLEEIKHSDPQLWTIIKIMYNNSETETFRIIKKDYRNGELYSVVGRTNRANGKPRNIEILNTDGSETYPIAWKVIARYNMSSLSFEWVK